MNINIGDVFYCIEATDHKTYRSPCRLCEDKREITFKGFTFKCPACDKETEVLRVCGYRVARYRVYSIKTVMPDDDWKMSEARRTYYGLYNKRGHGYYISGNHSRKELAQRFFYDNLNNENINRKCFDNAIFSDYKLAKYYAGKLTLESVEEVRKYNIEHGSNFDLPAFKIEHDKKSK